MITLKVGETDLPSPVSLQVDNEMIWTSDSGRDLSGLFDGDIIAEKKTVTIEWGVLEESEVVKLSNQLCAGFFPLTFRDAGGDVTIESYRGTLSKVMLGEIAGVLYYTSVSCKIVQR